MLLLVKTTEQYKQEFDFKVDKSPKTIILQLFFKHSK